MAERTDHRGRQSATVRSLLVEGWRFVPHSYAVVNQFQLLALGDVPGLRLWHRDLPFFGAHWRTVGGLLPAASEAALGRIPPPPAAGRADVLYRIAFPYDLSPGPARRTFVFGTSELQRVGPEMLARRGSLARQMEASETVIVAPSQWSRQGFVRSGAPPARVTVVPHGIDPSIFHPVEAAGRAALRRELGWGGHVVFLSVGTMRSAKGTRLMFKALAALAPRYPQLRLALKGGDAMYDSRQEVARMAESLTAREKQAVFDRIFYLGEACSFAALARLYQAADAYLSPYLAEGFNLPALEAAACGLPVVCTRGGPTDDFAHPRYFLGIHSRVREKAVPGDGVDRFLVPDLEHLVAQMERAIRDEGLRRQARQEMPGWVHQRFGWSSVTRRLVDTLFPDGGKSGPTERVESGPWK